MGRARAYFRALVESALDFAAPPGCAACDAEPALRGPFCPGCESLRGARDEHHSVAGVLLRVGGAYTSPLSDAIRRFKYAGRPDLARPLSGLIAASAAELGAGPGVLLVPVPLHPRRLAERGYNQAALLAAQIAGRVGACPSPRALVRRRYTTPQVGKSRADRNANVAGVFGVRSAGRLRGASVVLVDDVTTTGSTLRECIAALAAAGARVRGAVALARAPEVGGDG
jgi:ComF family protein